jgi:hypothetical protein
MVSSLQVLYRTIHGLRQEEGYVVQPIHFKSTEGGQETECNYVKATAQRSERSSKAVLMVIQAPVTKSNPMTCDLT